MKFRLVGIDENDKLHYHLGEGVYSSCPDKAKVYEVEDRTFVNDNAFMQTAFYYTLAKEKKERFRRVFKEEIE
ncbi:hypothetical protein [Candidatus Endomicrobiellum agilis]|uniref:hypothetical protein n=1 Tax=Candidatus Endomicrobiellum agilis TaxID=3238957 RepID=UPI0035827A91|nr:hypothetical protein [Endomicrobium sp.]MCA6085557.1 hypothetical protein [Endomicrobium sp.]